MDSLTLFDLVRPLPLGTTTSTLRRWESILAVCGHPEMLLVRVYGRESASALQALLTQSLGDTVVRVFVYHVTSPVEVEMIIDGEALTIKKCNIDRVGDILKPVYIEESSRRRWREVVQSIKTESVLIDLPTPESHGLLVRWLQQAEARMGKALLMDDLLDALFAMLQVKVASPVEESLVVKITVQAGILFVETLRGTDPVTIASRLAMAESMMPAGIPMTEDTFDAIDSLVWSVHD